MKLETLWIAYLLGATAFCTLAQSGSFEEDLEMFQAKRLLKTLGRGKAEPLGDAPEKAASS